MAMHFGSVDLSALYGSRVGAMPLTGPMEFVDAPLARAYFEHVRGELDVTIADEQAQLLDMLLPKTWPFSMSDPDLWEDVEPPVPYSSEAAAVVAETRLPWALAP